MGGRLYFSPISHSQDPHHPPLTCPRMDSDEDRWLLSRSAYRLYFSSISDAHAASSSECHLWNWLVLRNTASSKLPTKPPSPPPFPPWPAVAVAWLLLAEVSWAALGADLRSSITWTCGDGQHSTAWGLWIADAPLVISSPMGHDSRVRGSVFASTLR